MATLLTLVLPDFVVDVERRWEGLDADTSARRRRRAPTVRVRSWPPAVSRVRQACARASALREAARLVPARPLRPGHPRPLCRGRVAARRTGAALVRGSGLGRHRPGRRSRQRGEVGLAGRCGRRHAARHSRRARPRLRGGHRRHRGGGERRGGAGRTIGLAAGAAGLRRALPRAARPALVARAVRGRARAACRTRRHDDRRARRDGSRTRPKPRSARAGRPRGASARAEEPRALASTTLPRTLTRVLPLTAPGEFRGRAAGGRAPGRPVVAAAHADWRVRTRAHGARHGRGPALSRSRLHAARVHAAARRPGAGGPDAGGASVEVRRPAGARECGGQRPDGGRPAAQPVRRAAPATSRRRSRRLDGLRTARSFRALAKGSLARRTRAS